MTVGIEVWPGVVEMTEERYRYLAALAGSYLLAPRPWAYPLPGGGYNGDEQKGVYVVTNHAGKACYAGRTRPPTCRSAVAARRLAQHRREASKRQEWAAFWVLPLKWTTEAHVVDWLEMTVNARLGLPPRHRRRDLRIRR